MEPIDVLAIGCDPKLRKALREASRDAPARWLDEAPDALDPDTLGLLIIGPKTPRPWSVAQAVHRRNVEVQVAVLAARSDVAELAFHRSMMPFISRDAEVHALEDGVDGWIAELLVRTGRVRAHRARIRATGQGS